MQQNERSGECPPFTNTTRLLDRIREGSGSARTELVEQVFDRVMKQTRRILGNYRTLRRWVDTDDVFQEVAIRLKASLEKMAPDQIPSDAERLSRLVARQTRWAITDLQRRHLGSHTHPRYGRRHNSRAAESLMEGGADAFPILAVDNRAKKWLAIHECLPLLDEPLRQVVELRAFGEFTWAETSAHMNKTVDQARTLWAKALKKLHDLLESRDTCGPG